MPFWPLSGSPLADAHVDFSVSASRYTIPGNAIGPMAPMAAVSALLLPRLRSTIYLSTVALLPKPCSAATALLSNDTNVSPPSQLPS